MTCCVIVFAKAPIPGYAKTRLAKKIGDQAAAQLASRMLQAAVEQAVAARLGPVELCCSPDTSHPAFGECQQRLGVTLTEQGEGDLGQRMHRAFVRALRQFPRVLLTGTDAPMLDATCLQNAAAALSDHAAVFSPTFDGGYALIGLSRDIPDLFTDIPWSTDAVMQLSRQRLAQDPALTHLELAQLHDIDEAQDLIHVPPAWMKELTMEAIEEAAKEAIRT
jgi:rSAM/selenodomain-associated transferase 1